MERKSGGYLPLTFQIDSIACFCSPNKENMQFSPHSKPCLWDQPVQFILQRYIVVRLMTNAYRGFKWRVCVCISVCCWGNDLRLFQDIGEQRSIRGQQGVLEEEEEVGGVVRCQDQEEKMSIISETAPQWGVNHTLTANRPSLHGRALLIYSSPLPLYPSSLTTAASHSFTPLPLLPAIHTVRSLTFVVSCSRCDWKIHTIFARVHTEVKLTPSQLFFLFFSSA